MSVFLSVVIPSYNSSSTIEACLDSVIQEIADARSKGKIPETDFSEILVTDDGATDGSGKLLDDLAESFSSRKESAFIKIKILHIKNSGVATARNKAIDEAEGVFLSFNDSDDRWLSGSLSRRIEILEKHPDASLVTGNHGSDTQIILGLSKLSPSEELYEVKIENELFKNYFTVQNSLIRKAALKQIRFKNGMRYAEEMYFFCQLAVNEKCLFLNERLSESISGKERFGESGLSGNLFGMEKGELQCLNLVHKELGVPFSKWFKASVFSIMKFFRRFLIVVFRSRK